MKGKRSSLVKKIIIAAVIAIVILITATYACLSMFFSEHYFYHTMIEGVDNSYRTPIEAEEEFHNNLKQYSLKIIGRLEKSDTILPEDINLHYETDGFFYRIKEEQKGLFWIVGFFKTLTYELPNPAVYDEESLAEKIAALSFYKKEYQKSPNDPFIEYVSEACQYRLVEGSPGTELDEDRTNKAIREAIDNLEEELNLEDAGCYKVKTKEYDVSAMERLVEEANQYVKTVVTYEWGGNEVIVDGDTIHQWLIFNEDSLEIDQEKIKEFVAQTAKAYDTYGKTRIFKTTDDRELELKSGAYGWKTDREAEEKALLEAVKNGETVVKEPTYSFVANAGGDNDIGTSYVEIDLGGQHLYLYVEGVLLLESDFVSGSLSRGWGTPAGVFGLTYKTRNAVLRGENYETPVSYWMPFNGNIGMHDAGWRGSFGGEIYKTNGSHGCINLPPENAKFIYEYLYTGFPVICYY